MTLHRLTSITIGVPDIEPVAAYYRDFGLTPTADNWLTTTDGGPQLRLVEAPRRRLIQLGIGADDPDDIARISANLAGLGIDAETHHDQLTAHEPGTDIDVVVAVADQLTPKLTPRPTVNDHGYLDRPNARAAATSRDTPVQPRKLGHVVVGSTQLDATERFFIDGIGFKTSDTIAGLAAFLRCSTDHHNLLVQAAPVPFLHHTSWQVDDVDEIGRGALAMLNTDPARHLWGLGRHHIGSNFFWYLKDPAGNFSEYYADLDVIVDDELWDPQVWDGAQSLYSWGPPVPAQFLAPDDLVELITQGHG